MTVTFSDQMVDIENNDNLWTMRDCDYAVEVFYCDDFADYNYDMTYDTADSMDYADSTVYADSTAYTDYGTTDYYESNEIWWADSSWNFCTS